jgi:nucleoside-diphosphate-sugar epimerase
MEIIVIGATGYVGSEVLRCCMSDPLLAKVFVLTRRPLDAAQMNELPNRDKLSVILRDDWLHYDDELLDALKNTRACIWYVSPCLPS